MVLVGLQITKFRIAEKTNFGYMMLKTIEKSFDGKQYVIADRLRSIFLSLRGAKVGGKVRLGKNVSVLRPWCLSLGERSQLEHQVNIKLVNDNAQIQVGNNVFVGFNCEFDISEKLIIGNHVLIAPGCFITDHNHLHAADKFIDEQGCVSAPVMIEDDVWLGAHVIVLPGVTIGRGAIVAAGAVVNRNVDAMEIVAGVPARSVGKRS